MISSLAITDNTILMENKERDVIFCVVSLPVKTILEYLEKGESPPSSFTIAIPDEERGEITLRVGDVLTLPESIAKVLEKLGCGYIMEGKA